MSQLNGLPSFTVKDYLRNIILNGVKAVIADNKSDISVEISDEQISQLTGLIDFALRHCDKESLFFNIVNFYLYKDECKTLEELFERLKNSLIYETSEIINNFPKLLMMDLFHHSFKIDNWDMETGKNNYHYYFPDIKSSENKDTDLLESHHVREDKSKILTFNATLNNLFDNIRFNDILEYLHPVLISSYKKLSLPSMQHIKYKELKRSDIVSLYMTPQEYVSSGKSMVLEYHEFEDKKRKISNQDIEDFKKHLDNEYFVIRFLDELRSALFLKEWVGGKSLVDSYKLAHSIAFN